MHRRFVFAEGQKVGVRKRCLRLKRTVSVWLSVLTDAGLLGDLAFIADGLPD